MNTMIIEAMFNAEVTQPEPIPVGVVCSPRMHETLRTELKKAPADDPLTKPFMGLPVYRKEDQATGFVFFYDRTKLLEYLEAPCQL